MIGRPGPLPLAAAALAGLVAAASVGLATLPGHPHPPTLQGLATPVATTPAGQSRPVRPPARAYLGPATDPLPHPAAPPTPAASAREIDSTAGRTASVALPSQHVVAPVGVCPIVDGALEPPADVHRTCRWAGGARLAADHGTTALTGHINWVGQGTGAFGELGSLHAGDAVVTTDSRGRVRHWVVASVTFRDKERGVDLAAFAGPSGPRRLYLISCGGPFDPAAASYLDNIYVRAVPVSGS